MIPFGQLARAAWIVHHQKMQHKAWYLKNIAMKTFVKLIETKSKYYLLYQQQLEIDQYMPMPWNRNKVEKHIKTHKRNYIGCPIWDFTWQIAMSYGKIHIYIFAKKKLKYACKDQN